LLLYDVRVQGAAAAPEVAEALRQLSAHGEKLGIDAIILTRGGGSIEDLWAFNDEAVARAIAASRVPVVSGVGHETDFTIADFAADLRAATPSAAAEILTPDVAELRAGLERLQRDLDGAINDSIDTQRAILDDQRRRLRQLSPLVRVRNYRQRIDDWQARMTSTQRGRLKLLRERIEASERALIAASPQAILARGYALVSDAATGKRIASVREVRETIRVQFHDGTITAKAENDR
jgi:exodeoxyribonuclease VII large subunit